MSGRITTHVLDTVRGAPGIDMRVELFRFEGEARQKLAEARMNRDGRCDAPLLDGDGMQCGIYELAFHVGAYHRAAGLPLADPPFLDVVPIRFGVADPGAHYHVPLVLSGHSYVTYRGS